MSEDKYFFCYNKSVSDYLVSHGLKFITVAMDPKTKKLYSLYKQDSHLSELLKNYNK